MNNTSTDERDEHFNKWCQFVAASTISPKNGGEDDALVRAYKEIDFMRAKCNRQDQQIGELERENAVLKKQIELQIGELERENDVLKKQIELLKTAKN